MGGLARKAWERLRLHRVNLIALQRRRDPEQVLLQCLPRSKVDATLSRLLDRYRGPEPSETVEMFEGEKFFAAFERGIDVDAGRSLLSRVPWGVTLWPLLLCLLSPPPQTVQTVWMAESVLSSIHT